ncbi:Rpn family recombination-promoting nuclease/putative transposase [Candidatus Nucleicultrix amoebiphila]|uniref:Transposase (putative) YhgA-like domain-containing protein n=1 Tax=Candidatus Nucleicultrix amoebiphila FS5 TaxID=1414854 RepID=A0A1W6N5C2_9PROT|nr:Rpn family recombination-promoting nuclease/putative transposase [Candidatus Nucleicultrix amoebiphila]ARN84978.1 hypothetical protein GQ61_06405 [Candidatus Nucleicultrix amoebiphila FS5]
MGLQWVRPKFIASVVGLCVLISGESQGSFLMEDLVQGVNRLCLKKKPESEKGHTLSQNKRGVSRRGKTKLSLINKHLQRRSFTTRHPLLRGTEDSKKAKQIFANPIYDRTVKTILNNDEARLDFIRTFAKLPEVKSTELLDTHLNPLKRFGVLKKTLKNPDLRKLMKKIQKTQAVSAEDLQSPHVTETLIKLAPVLDDLIGIIPEERDSQVDVLCRLSTKDYAIVEVQVPKDDMWDARALAYAAHIYGNQLRRGQKWEKLKSVIGINILGGGQNKVKHWPEGEGFMRHYKMQDEAIPPHVIPQLQLIQYSLGNIKDQEEALRKDENLKNWLEYFNDAENKKEIPEDVSEGLKKAYELAKQDTHSFRRRNQYLRSRDSYAQHTEYTAMVKNDGIKKGREEGKVEGIKEGIKEASLEIAKKLLKKNLSSEEVAATTGLSLEDLKTLQEERH